MNALTTRMAGVRQGMGLAVSIVFLVWSTQEFLVHAQRPFPLALPQLLLGVAFIVWSIEEHLRGNKVFTGVFVTSGFLLFGYSAYALFR